MSTEGRTHFGLGYIMDITRLWDRDIDEDNFNVALLLTYSME